MGTQLQSMSEQERAAADNIIDDTMEGVQLQQQGQQQQGQQQQLQKNAMAHLQNTIPSNQAFMEAERNQVIMPLQNQSGGLLPPNLPTVVGEGLVRGPQVPGGGPVLNVDTSEMAFITDGIIPESGMGGRQIRRTPYRNFSSPVQYTPMGGGLPNQSQGNNITITKLE